MGQGPQVGRPVWSKKINGWGCRWFLHVSSLVKGNGPGKNPTAVQELATQPSRNHVVTDDAGRARSCFVVGFAKIPPKRELAALGTSLFAPFARAKCCSAGELTGLQQRAARFAQRMLLGGGIEETESFTPVGRAIDPWWRAPFKFGVHRNSLGPPWFTSSKTKLAEVWTGAPFVASCS